MLAVQGKRRAHDCLNLPLKRPVGKRLPEPCPGPGRQHPRGFVAMVFPQPSHLLKLRELYLRLPYTLQRAIFDKCLRREGDQSLATARLQGRTGRSHRPANAVAEGNKVLDLQFRLKICKKIPGFVADKMQRQ